VHTGIAKQADEVNPAIRAQGRVERCAQRWIVEKTTVGYCVGYPMNVCLRDPSRTDVKVARLGISGGPAWQSNRFTRSVKQR
jgi:hypothetical protein